MTLALIKIQYKTIVVGQVLFVCVRINLFNVFVS